ncbi:Lsr2 family DNA-binding protein [Kutzneria albida]|uniref:Lsr2 family DNA-binding protein n=1 Tax=Kutzneria albida TaxID=43357 RepID=UPI003B837FD9
MDQPDRDLVLDHHSAVHPPRDVQLGEGPDHPDPGFQGKEISDRGRIPADLVAEFHAAHGD